MTEYFDTLICDGCFDYVDCNELLNNTAGANVQYYNVTWNKDGGRQSCTSPYHAAFVKLRQLLSDQIESVETKVNLSTLTQFNCSSILL